MLCAYRMYGPSLDRDTNPEFKDGLKAKKLKKIKEYVDRKKLSKSYKKLLRNS